MARNKQHIIGTDKNGNDKVMIIPTFGAIDNNKAEIDINKQNIFTADARIESLEQQLNEYNEPFTGTLITNEINNTDHTDIISFDYDDTFENELVNYIAYVKTDGTQEVNYLIDIEYDGVINEENPTPHKERINIVNETATGQ
tara:strand:+ start:1221 stop:1649 length:429 start_codon:yes stop_codon:yes gene_type:complete